MATNLHRVLQNFQWVIASTTPTAGGRPFRMVDPAADEMENNTGTLRKFFVVWNSSDQDLDVTDGFSRQAPHEISTMVHYPTANVPSYERLRNNDNRDGYSDANPTDNIGLWSRTRQDDELDTGDDVWILTTRWECVISEVE
jgi:hypothetical protein